jgi:hypothetical protein
LRQENRTAHIDLRGINTEIQHTVFLYSKREMASKSEKVIAAADHAKNSSAQALPACWRHGGT